MISMKMIITLKNLWKAKNIQIQKIIHIDLQESQEIEKDSYGEMKVQEEPLNIVSKKSHDVSIASNAIFINLNFSLFSISLFLFYNH